MGEPADVLVTVENTGAREVRYATDGCELAVDISILLVDDNWIGGIQQSGIAAEFKAAALEPFGHAGFSPLLVPVADPAVPPDAGWDDSHEPIVAALDTWIVSEYEPTFLPPGAAIDAALADPTFAAWLAESPSSTWVNTHHVLDVEGRTWTIGLFRDPASGLYGSVILDAATGEAIGHRFE